MKNNSELTPEENLALDHTAALWNRLVLLTPQHPDDLNEARFHIHALQNLIAARPTFRTMDPNLRPQQKLKTPVDEHKTRTTG